MLSCGNGLKASLTYTKVNEADGMKVVFENAETFMEEGESACYQHFLSFLQYFEPLPEMPILSSSNSPAIS